MKKILYITLFLLCSCQIFAQNSSSVRKTVPAPPFRNNPQKGLYVGRMGAGDVISGLHGAIADALLDYNIDNPSSLKDDAGLTEYSGTCNIEIIDMASYGEEMMVLFRIQPDGKYIYVVRDTMSGFLQSKDGTSISACTTHRTIRVSYTDSAPDTAVEWVYEEFVEYMIENDEMKDYKSISKSNVETFFSM